MANEHEQEHSTTLGSLAKALAQAQAKLEDAKKDKTNPHFNSRYATLSSVRAAMSDVLPAHGLAVVQSFEPHGDGAVCIVTTLMHESGEWIRSKLYLPVTKRDAQGFGSAISYGRRYSLAAIVGIATDDDDDGNTATKPTATRRPANDDKPATIARTEVDPLVEKYAAAVDVAGDVKGLMAVFTALQTDRLLPAAAKEYVVQLCSTKRRKLEGKAA